MPTTIFTPQMLRNGTRAVPEIPAGGGGGFTNTYSLEFDGVDDYVSTSGIYSELDGQTKMTFSCWIKPTSATTSVIASVEDSGTTEQFRVVFHSSKYILIRTYTGNGRDTRTANSSIDLNVWTHITFCLDFSLSSGTRGKIFINGVDATSADAMNQASINTSGGALRIGARNVGTLLPFPGLIDEVAIWSGTDQRANISDIYSVDGAVDLSLLSTQPTNWFRMGDNGSFKSPQWLIPNNENKDKVSNYSMDFDGIDDKIELSTQSLGITGAISVSAWVKIPTTNTGGGGTNIQQFVCEDRTGGTRRNWSLSWRGGGLNRISAVIFDSGGSAVVATTTAIVPNDGNWHHVMLTYTGDTTTDGLKLFVDGLQRAQATSANGGTRSTAVVQPTIGSLSNSFTWMFEGSIDEVAIFNTDQSANISTIYNSGEPTTISGAVAHYRMGEEATFSGGVWTVPDQVGSNDGTSANMTIEDRVGTAPSSSNNALSFNMDLVDRVEDVPS